MPDARPGSLPRWKLLVAGACVAYLLVAGILPVLMLPFVNVLPFVHERGFVDRLLLSSIGTVTVLVTLLALDRRRWMGGVASLAPQGAWWRTVQHWFGVVGGFAMFTAGAAWLSPNSCGLLARVLPSQPYREVVVLESVAHGGTGRRAAVSLVYRDRADGHPRYLVLSGRLFDDPRVVPGDVVELRGEAGPVGIYVRNLEVQAGPAAPRRGEPPR